MPNLHITFRGYPTLTVDINNTELGRRYYNLVKANYSKQFPSYRDRIRYTPEYMLELAQQAKTAFGWQWSFDQYDLSITPQLHRDLERLLGETGFADIPAEYDNLLNELHYCLHIVQHPDIVRTRNGVMQIEWFNDDSFDLDSDFEFSTSIDFGDIVFQNPYVGHSPAQIYNEQDYSNLDSACRFPNRVKPGVVIAITNPHTIDRQAVLHEFERHNPAFVAQHTVEKILHYTGFPVIGRVLNINDLRTIVDAPDPIALELIEFDE
jgi:hypothetical protein